MTWNIQEIEDAALKLISVDGLGGATLSELIRKAGGVNEAGEAVLKGEASVWLPANSGKMLQERMQKLEADQLRWSAEDVQAKVVIVMDDDFPQLLSPLPACPCALWYRGTLDAVRLASVAIVGSRKCSKYGVDQATLFADEISRADLAVVSGGARGIDRTAHQSALRSGGHTVVVLGSGLSIVYPPEHAPLFDAVVQEGGVVLSEFPCTRPPRPANFPRRNRIVSGLSSTLLVVEAARRSGALITARIAVEEHGRQAYAVPGRLGDPSSAGCLQALHDGWMEMALNPEPLIEEAISSWSRLSRIQRYVNDQ
ncbi:MAG: DNA-protecting protein DprA [Phycisphaerae bacterium]|jgi:DNA processing protein|nr:DNA-protecting protein DprA [Phycisphaerae bacterium]